MISLEEAWALVAAAVPEPLEAERVPLGAARGRIAAEPAAACVDLPPFDRSAMDGFAVRAAELAAGPLRLAGEIAAGAAADSPLPPRAAVSITTGAPLPPGADAVLQVEHADVSEGAVAGTRPLEAGRHVRRRGEDVRAGSVLVRPGERLTTQRLTALASSGLGAVAVHARPRVHILATGSELLPIGAPPEPGRVHESNGLTLALLTERAGGRPEGGGVVPDEARATREAVEAGLAADVLLVSGGVSVGPHDHVKPALAACGVEEVFWRVRMKPGKPLWFGRRGSTLVFGLPGNPLSSLVGFLAFVEPALARLQGQREALMRTVPARLTASAGPADGRTTFLTARFAHGPDGVLEAAPTGRQGSHMTGALGDSGGFVIADRRLAEGELAPAVLLD